MWYQVLAQMCGNTGDDHEDIWEKPNQVQIEIYILQRRLPMAWPHIENAGQQYFETVIALKRKRGTKNTWRRDLEANITGHRAKGAQLTKTGEVCSGQKTSERSCAWNMLQEEPSA